MRKNALSHSSSVDLCMMSVDRTTSRISQSKAARMFPDLNRIYTESTLIKPAGQLCSRQDSMPALQPIQADSSSPSTATLRGSLETSSRHQCLEPVSNAVVVYKDPSQKEMLQSCFPV